MASSVFFRFKSQKEPTRVTFDGTGISVFELKKHIITVNKLGDGRDFELTLSSPDTSEEYDDDLTIIPRSTTVIARRLPAAIQGKGGAVRYVTGKPPVNAKRSEAPHRPVEHTNIESLQTEEERMAAVLQMGADQWQSQKKEMANITPVFRPGAKGKNVNVPDHPPPQGYTCHRCGQKGHWIQACPTNDDPNFENRPRAKRTTGIPKSLLKVVDKPPTGGEDGGEDQQKVMIDADGKYVIAVPDQASWEQYQAKANKSALAQQEAAVGSKELQDRGLECSIDKRLFVDPVKTPCCQKTYCEECITNALLDENLQCPNCGKDEVSVDDLTPDSDMVENIRSYQAEKAKEEAEKKVANQKSASPEAQAQGSSNNEDKPPSRSASKSPAVKSESGSTGDSPGSKKRKAEEPLESDRKTPNPAPDNAAKNEKSFSKPPPTGPKADAQKNKFPPELAFMNQPNFLGNTMPNTMPNMMPNMNMNMMTMPMNMNGMGMNMMQPNMFNPMMAMNGMGGPQWNPMSNMMPNQPNNMYGTNGMNGMNGNGGTNKKIKNAPKSDAYKNKGNNGGRGGYRNFNNRPATNDSPYFRQPVNPQRHQGRRNVQRPADYREI